MFILIRMGKDRKDRDKIGFFVMFIKSTRGMTEKKEALYFHCSSCNNVLHSYYCLTIFYLYFQSNV